MPKYEVTINGFGTTKINADNHTDALVLTLDYLVDNKKIADIDYPVDEVAGPNVANASVKGKKVTHFYRIRKGI